MAAKKPVPKNEPKTSDVRAHENLRFDIILVVSIAVSVLLFLGEIGVGGPVLDVMSRFTFGMFGFFAYIIPFVLFLLTLFLIANRDDPHLIGRFILIMLIIVFICAACELVKTGGEGSGPASYISSYEARDGGGFFGGSIAGLFYMGFGTAGAAVLDIACLIVCLLILFGRSLFLYLEKEERSRKKKRELDRAEKQYMEELRREKERRFTVKERIRDNQQEEPDPGDVLLAGRETIKRGVNLNTVITPSDGRGSDEMNELYQDPSAFEDINPDNRVPESEYDHFAPMPVINSVSAEPVAEPEPENDAMRPVRETVTAKVSEPETGNYAEPDVLPEMSQPIAPVTEQVATPVSEPVISSQISEPQEKPVRKRKTASPKEMPEISAAKESADYVLPPVSLLKPSAKNSKESESALNDMSARLQKTLRDFGVNARVTDFMSGPAVTRFEIEPETGVKVSKILNLSDDIKLNLAVADIRIEAPIPGKAAIGIEVPNKKPQMVSFRELMESSDFNEQKKKSKISFAAGKDIAGKIIISDIGKMPHLLIAGATGSGKSVCINTIIMSILYEASPDEVRFIMIDPKVVELNVYNGIPHLLAPVVTDPKKAAGALQWAVTEMMNRYKKFADESVRDMKAYNEKIAKGEIVENVGGEEVRVTKKMPQIVVIVDELADLMMVAGKAVEASICRLAQLARAAGIHLIIATQRPSADIITGLIKANMPSRIAFAVTSGIDSRVVLDMSGAEKLLGKGDMLYFPQGMSKPLRVQGAFVSDEEVTSVVEFIKQNNQNDEAAAQQKEIEKDIESSQVEGSSSGNETVAIDGNQEGFSDGRDQFFADAGRFIAEKGKASIGMLQRKYRVGFNRAARIIDQLEEAGVVGPEEGTKPRRVIMTLSDFENYLATEENND